MENQTSESQVLPELEQLFTVKAIPRNPLLLPESSDLFSDSSSESTSDSS
ncbi:unnamed protein product, partial [Porites lobata]